MAKSPQIAIAKYNRNVQGKGGLWANMASQGAAKYSTELGAFLGMGQAPPAWVSGFQAGVADPGAQASWERNTQNGGQNWYAKFQAKARAAAGGGGIALPVTFT